MELTGRNIIGDKLSKESETAFFGENPTTGRKLEPAFFEACYYRQQDNIRGHVGYSPFYQACMLSEFPPELIACRIKG
jgi:hypothetical protein